MPITKADAKDINDVLESLGCTDELIKYGDEFGVRPTLLDDVGEGGIKTVNGYEAIVNIGQQNKHIPGTNEYKNALNNGQSKSILYGDINDIQDFNEKKLVKRIKNESI